MSKFMIPFEVQYNHNSANLSSHQSYNEETLSKYRYAYRQSK